MAHLWKADLAKNFDFLGKDFLPFQGEAHRHVARKFLSDIHIDHKQALFFYGDIGMGKTRLAKETARELVRLVKNDSANISTFVFLIDCEGYEREEAMQVSDIQRKVAQKVGNVNVDLQRTLSKCRSSEFYNLLADYLSLERTIFLFLIDGIVANSKKAALNFLNSLIKSNENVLAFTTSSEYLALPSIAQKVSSHNCSGLTTPAAINLLRNVAGSVPGLSYYEDELITLCHLNPYLIMRTGQQMRADAQFTYSPEEMKELLEHSLMLAVGSDNVPEKDDVFGRELALAKTLTANIGKNILVVMDQSTSYFSPEDVRVQVDMTSGAVVKKAYLEELTSHSVLSEENGFFSLNVIFGNFFKEQRVLLNQSKDNVVGGVYQVMEDTLRTVLSAQGVEKVFMIQQEELDRVVDLEKRIPKVGATSDSRRFIHRGHFINACASFLSNVPLSDNDVSVFKEKCFALLHQAQAQERKQDAGIERYDINKQFGKLAVNDSRKRKTNSPKKYRGHEGGAHGGQLRMAPSFGAHGDGIQPYCSRGDQLQGSPHQHQMGYGNEFLGQGETNGGATSSCHDPSGDRFDIQTASPFSVISNFSSLASTDDSVHAIHSERYDDELSTVPLSSNTVPCIPPPETHYQTKVVGQVYQPSEPQEDSFHSELAELAAMLPSEQSFHDWQDHPGIQGNWSMEGNPPSPRRH